MHRSKNKNKRRLAAAIFMALFFFPSLWAGGRKDKIDSRTADGRNIWQQEYDLTEVKPGKYNVIVEARDAAGNTSESGPFNIRVDPNAGLPVARVVYPESNAVLRRDINLIGVASGRFGVSQVMVRLDDGDYRPAEGTDYWSRLYDGKALREGRHTIYAQAFDTKGTPGPEFSVSFTIDKSAPVIDLISHKIGDLISGKLTILGQADDVNGVASVEYSMDGGKEYVSLSLKTRKDESAVTFSFPLKTKTMEDGPVVIYIRATDKTGLVSVKPYLFFVDNQGPELAIFSPAEDEDVYGKIRFAGRFYDAVGLERLYYELGSIQGDITLQPGDPFWAVDVDLSELPKAPSSIKISAVDKSGNISSVIRKFTDNRKLKTPGLVIDYPPPSGLASLTQADAIYGHILPGFDPESIIIEGAADEIPAGPGFRIPPELIPQGRGTLRIFARGKDQSVGTPIQVRTVKPAPDPAADGTVPGVNLIPSPISVSSPPVNSWFTGASVTVEGHVSSSAAGSRLEYRLYPEDGWRPLALKDDGTFRGEITTALLAEGPVHLELRTLKDGVEHLPVYHPLNCFNTRADIQFISPGSAPETVHGNVTVLGTINFTAPIKALSYSVDGASYRPLSFISKYGRAWFSLVCDFTALNKAGQRLVVRAVDISGAVYEQSPSTRFDDSADTPAMIVNTPSEGDTITGDFAISGVAFDDDGISAVYWRVLTGDEAIAAAGTEAVEAPDFQRLSTSQSFDIEIPISSVSDGEHFVEVYAEDIYGSRSRLVSRRVKISTAPPENHVTSPGISDYNRKAIIVSGSASDANGISSVSLSMDNGVSWQQAPGKEEWSLGLNTESYVDGVYSLLLRTVDNYGVKAISNALINIDNTPPDLTIGVPFNGAMAGTRLDLAGQVKDNLELRSLRVKIVNVDDSETAMDLDLDTGIVIRESLDISELPEGEYVLSVSAVDQAGNESLVNRKVLVSQSDQSATVAIFNPISGEFHSGPLTISGKVSGGYIPDQVALYVKNRAYSFIDVDRYGMFHLQYPASFAGNEEQDSPPAEWLGEDEELVFSAVFDTPSGERISSEKHTVHYVASGPVLTVDSHQDGDVITGRPWLSGQAWFSTPAPKNGEPLMSRQEKKGIAVKEVLVSFDNGRSFQKARGGEKWKFRLETGDLPLGPQAILIKAGFANGDSAVRRLMLTVDSLAPHVETLEPIEDSTHRDNLLVYGSAEDEFEIDSVTVRLRPGDKAGYAVPRFIQGLYFDTNFLGATTADFGLGLSFFDDNVKFQFQAGFAPSRDTPTGEKGRFVGMVFGIKLLANIFYLPFDYFFGRDWAFFSMSVALGANFSYFTMDPDNGRPPLYMGAVLGQWEFARMDMSHFFPNWKYLKIFSLYTEPILWFASSDINAAPIFRITLGTRITIF
jgi:hypothetical protein